MFLFVVVTRWAKNVPTSPGYVNHYAIESIIAALDQGSQLNEVLATHNIPPEHFDRGVYETYYAYIHDRPHYPIIFDVASDPNGFAYSMGAYDTDVTDPNRDNTARDAYLNLLGVTATRVSGFHDMTGYSPGLVSLQNLFTALNT
jgi:hypothetical protein